MLCRQSYRCRTAAEYEGATRETHRQVHVARSKVCVLSGRLKKYGNDHSGGSTASGTKLFRMSSIAFLLLLYRESGCVDLG